MLNESSSRRAQIHLSVRCTEGVQLKVHSYLSKTTQRPETAHLRTKDVSLMMMKNTKERQFTNTLQRKSQVSEIFLTGDTVANHDQSLQSLELLLK